jgi:hypothetical protein
MHALLIGQLSTDTHIICNHQGTAGTIIVLSPIPRTQLSSIELYHCLRTLAFYKQARSSLSSTLHCCYSWPTEPTGPRHHIGIAVLHTGLIQARSASSAPDASCFFFFASIGPFGKSSINSGMSAGLSRSFDRTPNGFLPISNSPRQCG